MLDLIFNCQLYIARKIDFNRVITKMIITKHVHEVIVMSSCPGEEQGCPDHFKNFSAKTRRISRRNLDLVLSHKDQETHGTVELERHSRFNESEILMLSLR